VDAFAGAKLAKGNLVFKVTGDLFGQGLSGSEGVHGLVSLLHRGC